MTLGYTDEPVLDIGDFDWSSLGKVEIDFVEMERQRTRIEELGENTKRTMNDLISAINALAALVGCNYSVSLAMTSTKMDIKIKTIISSMNNQIERYKILNEEINNEIVNKIDKLVDALLGEQSNSEISQFVDTYNFVRENIENRYKINDENAYNNGDSNIGCLDEKFGGSSEKWDVLEEMYQYFCKKGCTDEQIAGIIGNAIQESGLVLDIKNPNSTAEGLFQWLDMQLYNGESNQPSSWDLQSQLDHAWHQIQNKRDMQGVSVLEHLNNNSLSVSGSARTFATFFEGVGNDQYGYRTDYANAVYAYIKNNINNNESGSRIDVL